MDLLVVASIALNQVGFEPTAPKVAVLADAGPAIFWVKNADEQLVYQGTLGPAQEWSAEGAVSRRMDWSAVQTPGDYTLEVPSYGVQAKVHVQKAPWAELGRAAIKAYYFQRASLELKPEFAGPYARMAGHPDDVVHIHTSAASASRPEGTVISSPKGWYDAGDYNKYMVNSGISVWTLLALFENYPEYIKSLHMNIPESRGPLPDLLAEVRWNLDWMLTMQDPADGGVYHKLTNLRFDPMVMPIECQQQRYVVMKSTAAAFHFAATMAQASRVYAPYDDIFAQQCLRQARRAFVWGQENPLAIYRQPEDVRTGRYDDEHLEDEQQWAAYELFITSGDSSYLKTAQLVPNVEYGVPNWQKVGTLGLISMAMRKQDIAARAQILSLADHLLQMQEQNAYQVSMTVQDFVWGSNGMAGNQGLLLLVAYQMTNDVKYRQGAIHMADYLLGNNPLRQSFVTGFGRKSPKHPHHRLSEADHIEDPIPGLLVGGPNPGRQDAKNCPAYPYMAPAMSYMDLLCSYASNEIAINWNAPLAYLINGLQATEHS